MIGRVASMFKAIARRADAEPILSIHADAAFLARLEALSGLPPFTNPLGRLGALWQHGALVHLTVEHSHDSQEQWRLGYTRLEHSQDVARRARIYANLGHVASIRDAVALELASYFHDTGHLALSHTGDQLTRKLLTSASASVYVSAADPKRTDPIIVPHEIRSEAVLRRFLHTFFDETPGALNKDSAERSEALFETCAWLMNPTLHARPAHTSFLSSPLSATTTTAMDLDRCSYLVMDVPHPIRSVTSDAVDAWMTLKCPKAEQFLVRVRALLHERVYPLISQKTIARFEKAYASNKDAQTLLDRLCSEATSSAEPVLCDGDLDDLLVWEDAMCVEISSATLRAFVQEAHVYEREREREKGFRILS